MTDVPFSCCDQELSIVSSMPPLPEHDTSEEATYANEVGTVANSPSSGGAAVSEKVVLEESPFISASADPLTKPLVKRRRLRRTGDVSSAAAAQPLVVVALSTDDHVEK